MMVDVSRTFIFILEAAGCDVQVKQRTFPDRMVVTLNDDEDLPGVEEVVKFIAAFCPLEVKKFVALIGTPGSTLKLQDLVDHCHTISHYVLIMAHAAAWQDKLFIDSLRQEESWGSVTIRDAFQTHAVVDLKAYYLIWQHVRQHSRSLRDALDEDFETLTGFMLDQTAENRAMYQERFQKESWREFYNAVKGDGWKLSCALRNQVGPDFLPEQELIRQRHLDNDRFRRRQLQETERFVDKQRSSLGGRPSDRKKLISRITDCLNSYGPKYQDRSLGILDERDAEIFRAMFHFAQTDISRVGIPDTAEAATIRNALHLRSQNGEGPANPQANRPANTPANPPGRQVANRPAAANRPANPPGRATGNRPAPDDHFDPPPPYNEREVAGPAIPAGGNRQTRKERVANQAASGGTRPARGNQAVPGPSPNRSQPGTRAVKREPISPNGGIIVPRAYNYRRIPGTRRAAANSAVTPETINLISSSPAPKEEQ